jgi:hypothetical protein
MPAKKTVKKPTANKPVVKAAPVAEHKCECGEHCHCHGKAHWVKHIIVWAIIFALGMACGKMLPCGHKHKQMPKMHPVFVNGCLDVQSVTNPKLQEKLATADADNDGCISVEEYRTARKEMRPMNKGARGPKGPLGPLGPIAPKAK